MDRERIKQEARRYLGYGRKEADPATGQLLEACVEELFAVAACRLVSREYELFLPKDSQRIMTAAFRTDSHHLRINLEGCEKILLFAATLGAETDKRIARYEKLSMSRAVVFQAAAAAFIEEYCDMENTRWEQEYREQGWYLRPRFSPGYGDFPLECQKSILGALEAGKRIGLILTDSLLMIPSKSVTAVIGISRFPGTCGKRGCSGCGKTDCAYRV